MTSSEKCSRQDLFDFFAALDIETTTHEHEAVFTVSESHKIKENLPGGHSKKPVPQGQEGQDDAGGLPQ